MRTQVPVDQILSQLAEHTGLQLQSRAEIQAGPVRWDVVLSDEKTTFLIEFKTAGTTDAVGSALHAIQPYAPRKDNEIPLLVVPFMGAVGKELCKQAGVSWMDLSGNARIIMPSLRIAIEGRPNRFVVRGRPADPFAPKSSRIARVLLLNPQESFTQSEITRRTGLDKGFVSRIVQRLYTAGLIQRVASGRVRVENPTRLLGAWHATYEFERHNISRGVIAARSGSELLERLHTRATSSGLEYALTGLAAAWLYAPFAAYRTVTLYVRDRVDRVVFKEFGIHETSAGSNVWLVFPNDEGVFLGMQEREQFPCVSPLQTYLDLKSQPERAAEAAEELTRVYLPWAAT